MQSSVRFRHALLREARTRKAEEAVANAREAATRAQRDVVGLPRFGSKTLATGTTPALAPESALSQTKLAAAASLAHTAADHLHLLASPSKVSARNQEAGHGDHDPVIPTSSEEEDEELTATHETARAQSAASNSPSGISASPPSALHSLPEPAQRQQLESQPKIDETSAGGKPKTSGRPNLRKQSTFRNTLLQCSVDELRSRALAVGSTPAQLEALALKEDSPGVLKNSLIDLILERQRALKKAKRLFGKYKGQPAEAVFRQFDTDNSGYLDFDEFSAALRKLGSRMTPESLRKAMDTVDTDGNNQISMGEFKQFWSIYQTQQHVSLIFLHPGPLGIVFRHDKEYGLIVHELRQGTQSMDHVGSGLRNGWGVLSVNGKSVKDKSVHDLRNIIHAAGRPLKMTFDKRWQ